MRDDITKRFRPDVAAFVQAQANASRRSVTEFVETVLLREKIRLEDDHDLTVQAAPELLQHKEHKVVRDADETDADYAARTELFAALLDHAQRG